MNPTFTKSLAFVALLPLGGSALAASCGPANDRPYSLAITNTSLNSCATVETPTAEKFIDALKAENLQQTLAGSNTDRDGFSTNANFNSLLTQLNFAQNSSSLNFSIPALGISKTFNGATRNDSMELLRDYLKTDDMLGRIMNYQAKNSAFSPITGQNGLIPSAMGSDFDSSFTDVVTHVGAGTPGQAENAGNQMQINASVGFGKTQSQEVKVLSLPLSYSFRNEIDPRRQLILQMPISYTEIGSAKSIQGGVGVAYRFPVTDNWTITPNVKYSMVGSADLATAAGLYSATLGSAYVMGFDGFDMAIGNMVGVYKTAKFSSDGYTFDPNIMTTGLRNGIMLLRPVTVRGSRMSMEYSFIDTRYFGDKPFADNSQEIGITLGTNKSAYSSRSYLRGGLSYQNSRSGNLWKLNVGYWF